MTPSYTLGITFIVLVSLIWSASSIVVQFLYETLNFNSPFLLTYIGSSLFVIFIPSRLIWERWKWRLGSARDEYRSIERNRYEESEIIPWRNPTLPRGILTNDNEGTSNPSEICQLTTSSLERRRNPTLPRGILTNDDESTSNPSEICQLTTSSLERKRAPNHGLHKIFDDTDRDLILSHIDHLRMASKVAPLWFLSNYCYNLSLQSTSITSSTVLASTGSVFTFLFSISCGHEQFTKWKFIGVILAVCGSVVTSIHDVSSTGDDGSEENTFMKPKIWGDVAGIVAAVGYGGYTVLIRKVCPSDENLMSMQLLLGYVGTINMVFFGPMAILILCDNLSPSSSVDMEQSEESGNFSQQQRLTWFVVFCVVMKGLFDNVLSDYLWARAIILTSATVATVGLGLTIPLALLSDAYVMKKTDVWSVGSIFGAISVLVGFIFVNIGELRYEEVSSHSSIDSVGDIETSELEISKNAITHCASY